VHDGAFIHPIASYNHQTSIARNYTFLRRLILPFNDYLPTNFFLLSPLIMAFLSSYTSSNLYSFSTGIPLVIALLSLWMIGKVVYRLIFHPLARFPGPKLAASTVFFEFYHDGIRGGQYTFEIADMHEKYGTFARTLYYWKLYRHPAASMTLQTCPPY